MGVVALLTLPREEEPQISVPMVDIHIRAPGLKAEDAVKLVTEPMETIVKGIDGVEHVYSQSRDDAVMVHRPPLVVAPPPTPRCCGSTTRCVPTSTASRSGFPSR